MSLCQVLSHWWSPFLDKKVVLPLPSFRKEPYRYRTSCPFLVKGWYLLVKKGQYFPLHLSFAERRHCIHFPSLAKIPCLPLAKEQYCLSYRKHSIAPFSFLGKKAVSPSPPLLKLQCAPLALSGQKGSISPSSL